MVVQICHGCGKHKEVEVGVECIFCEGLCETERCRAEAEEVLRSWKEAADLQKGWHKVRETPGGGV